MVNNPFDITKAVDYTDAEIYKYWVDLGNENQGFEGLIKPDTLMPMIIVGSKGSGKTHVMKYFSYELQKIRCMAQSASMQEGLAREKFIGIYIRCSGFNSDKFSGKGVSAELWSILHSYFWELWVGERLVNVLIDLLKSGLLEDVNETEIVHDILGMFLKPKDGIDTFEELNSYLLDLQRDVDYQVQNFMFMGQECPQIEILLNTAKLTYDIPALLKKKISFFKNKYILYLIDELENFSANQQQLIQTLIREKPVACTFRVGTRPYGIRTLKTLRGVEENHDGSEFEGVILDEFLRNYKYYPEYVTKILENRLRNSGISLPRDFRLKDLFAEQSNTEILEMVAAKKDKQSRSYMNKLKGDLKKLPLSEENIASILENIAYPNNILVERTSVMLMYSAIKENKDSSAELFIEASREISRSAYAYSEGKCKDTLHATKLDKFKQDLIDNLAREGRVDIPYNGLEKLIDLSCGTPRTILCLLKAAFNNQYFNTGKIPFEEGRKLSVKSQRIGIESTYDWFFEENRIPSVTQARATDAVMRIGDYLRSVRFSDLPPQCSINIFTLNASELSSKARDVFELLLSYSYIVQTDERRQINSDNKTHVYRLNTIFFPKYELALSKRGAINFSVADAELFFNIEKKDEYEKFVANKLRGYNFPFGGKKEQSQLLFNLF
jgi:hypothetical protein